MAELKKIYIDDIANLTKAMLENASKKHKSVIGYCIFVEGDHYCVLTPEYENEKEEDKTIRKLIHILVQRPDICEKFAQFVLPPARFHEREAKKAAKNKD